MVYAQISRTPVVVPVEFSTNETYPAANVRNNGFVRCSGDPESAPVFLKDNAFVLPDGGITKHPVTVDPPVGRVMVLSPLARVTSFIDPGLAALVDAEYVSVAIVSTE